MLVNEMVQLGAKRSGIRELFEYGLKRKAEVGAQNVFDFSIGNPSVPAPQAVQDAYREIAARKDTVKVHGYTSATGAMSVREAIAKNLNERFGCGARAQNLFFTCGAAPALMSTMKAMCVADAEYIVLAPYFPEYPTFIHAVGGKIVVVPANTTDFDLHVEDIEPYYTEHTQAIIINSPNNPSGVVYKKEALEALAAQLRRMSEKFGHPHPEHLREHRRLLFLVEVAEPAGRAYRLRVRAGSLRGQRRPLPRGRRFCARARTYLRAGDLAVHRRTVLRRDAEHPGVR